MCYCTKIILKGCKIILVYYKRTSRCVHLSTLNLISDRVLQWMGKPFYSLRTTYCICRTLIFLNKFNFCFCNLNGDGSLLVLYSYAKIQTTMAIQLLGCGSNQFQEYNVLIELAFLVFKRDFYNNTFANN